MFGWSKRDEKKANALFARYVRPELAEVMKSPTFNPKLNELSEADVNFILVAVDGRSPNEIGQKLGRIAEIAVECGWYVDCLFSNLAVVIDGPIPLTRPSFESRTSLLQKLRQAFPNDVKTVHGQVRTPWGSYGGERRTFGAMLPNFIRMVSQLEREAYGNHLEYGARYSLMQPTGQPRPAAD